MKVKKDELNWQMAGILGIAALPFSIAGTHQILGWFMPPYFDNEDLLVWGSIGVGLIITCVIASQYDEREKSGRS